MGYSDKVTGDPAEFLVTPALSAKPQEASRRASLSPDQLEKQNPSHSSYSLHTCGMSENRTIYLSVSKRKLFLNSCHECFPEVCHTYLLYTLLNTLGSVLTVQGSSYSTLLIPISECLFLSTGDIKALKHF